MNKKKGFTLIELMIVLAIIAILAVVLIPRAGSMKDSARNSGVLTNVNNVRGYLESKTGINFIASEATLVTNLTNTFTGTNALTNPFNSASTGVANTSALANVALNPAGTPAIAVYDASASTTTAVNTALAGYAAYSNNRGIVFVYECSDGYVVFGLDNAGSVVNIETVARN